MSNIRIKKCPFTHDRDEQNLKVKDVGTEDTGPLWAVACFECGSIGPVSSDSPEDSIAKWNRRQIIILPQEEYDKLLKETEEDNGETKEEA